MLISGMLHPLCIGMLNADFSGKTRLAMHVSSSTTDVVIYSVGGPDAQAVAAPVNEDLNDEDDEGVEENALAGSTAVEKKAAKAVAKQQMVTWIGNSQTSADCKQMYMCVVLRHEPNKPLASVVKENKFGEGFSSSVRSCSV